jgi:hypothetical protein
MSGAACLHVPHDVPVRDTVNGWGIRDSPGPIRPRAGERARLRTPKQARSNVTTPTAWTVGIAELEIHNSERCRKGIPLRDTAEGFTTPNPAPITTRAHPRGGSETAARDSAIIEWSDASASMAWRDRRRCTQSRSARRPALDGMTRAWRRWGVRRGRRRSVMRRAEMRCWVRNLA